MKIISAISQAGSRPPAVVGVRSAAGFTMVEVAISLAIIGIALVAIVGVLPLGMNVQRDNREATTINQDATVFLEAIRNGSSGLDDLTNYVYAITNAWTLFNSSGSAINSGVDGYSSQGSQITKLTTPPNFPLTNGLRIIGLLSTPEYTLESADNFAPTNNLFSGGYSNHIIAYVRSMSGLAVEKPPQDNDIVREETLSYRLYCVNAPVPVDTNVFLLPAAQQAYSRQLAANLHELRLTFLWPILPNGGVGKFHQTYRVPIAGKVEQGFQLNQPLYFYQSQSFTNAP